jgi:hypothetical protein
MEMMKKIAAVAASLLLPLYALAQDVTYALPFTTFTVEVHAVEEIHHAGPYSQYAKDLLNLNVPASDTKKTWIKEIRIVPHLEADPWAQRFTAPAGNSSLLAMSAQGLIAFGDGIEGKDLRWRFQPVDAPSFGASGITGPMKLVNQIEYKVEHTEEGEIRYPVEHSVSMAKTVEDKAGEAADAILQARKDRHNIAIGNTDANYSGESMAAALAELTKIEEEYLLLFTGYSVTREFSASFEVMPSATARTHRYTAFYMAEDGYIGRENRPRSKPYELEFTPVSVPDVKTEAAPADARKKPEKLGSIHYRIPAICRLRLLENGNPVMEQRVPVYQLGREAEMPINQ